ncbi:MAG: hypothetical protein IJT95_06260, partial [Abditibacteriota bacterium]|nr:hypothetical protein [Abditibacteriota bacterium]
MTQRLFLLLLLVICSCSVSALPGAVVVIDPSFSKAERAAAEALREAFSHYYAVSEIDFASLSSPEFKAPDALLIPNGRRLPLDCVPFVERFAEAGGDLAVLAAPLWKDPLVKTEKGYVSLADYRAGVLDTDPDTVVFRGESLEGWSRGFSEHEKGASHTLSVFGNRKCMDVTLENLHNYDTYAKTFDRPFTHGEDVLEIVACGGERTSQLVVECSEKDGSRWMAVVPLSGEWQRTYIHASRFGHWSGGEGRGGAGDSLDLAEVAKINVGMALTHVPAAGEGAHHYRIAQIGASKQSARHLPLLDNASLPDLDGLSPAWKTFDCSSVKSIRPAPLQETVSGGALPLPPRVSALNPRQQGGGFDKGREWRWINLLEAYGPKGEFRGAAAAMKIHFSGRFAGSVTASFAPGDPAWYSRKPVKEVLRQTAAAMAEGLFFLDGGSDFYTYFPDMQPVGGARIINVSGSPRQAECRISLDGSTVFGRTLTVLPGECADLQVPLDPDKSRESRVSCLLLTEGRTVDRVENSINFAANAGSRFVTMENGHFMLDGKLWKPWGVNYMPSSGAGNDKEYFNNYLADYSYDPVVVERDFQKLRDIGFNSINIFVFTGYAEDLNLIDMLRLADKYGFKAVLSLRPGTPFDEVSESAETLIPLLRLADNDTVFSYDVAWEPSWGDVGNREWFDGAW